MNARHLYYLVWLTEQETQGRLDGSRPGGPLRLNAEVERALRFQIGLSHVRQSDEDDASCSNHDWISSSEAAAILGWSERTVQRRAEDLDGHRLSSRKLVFRERVVRDYAAAMNDGRDSS